MRTFTHDADRRNDLRSRAVAHLASPDIRARIRADSSAALSVLYDLASSSSTAADALALLHELQVHQVEVELQDEELRRSRVEVESSLARYVQLYDHAPFAYATVDGDGNVRELNPLGQALLGVERGDLGGRSLESLLDASGVATLRAMLAQLALGTAREWGPLSLRARADGQSRRVHASVCPDPAGGGFLIALMEV